MHHLITLIINLVRAAHARSRGELVVFRLHLIDVSLPRTRACVCLHASATNSHAPHRVLYAEAIVFTSLFIRLISKASSGGFAVAVVGGGWWLARKSACRKHRCDLVLVDFRIGKGVLLDSSVDFIGFYWNRHR